MTWVEVFGVFFIDLPYYVIQRRCRRILLVVVGDSSPLAQDDNVGFGGERFIVLVLAF